MSGPLSSLKILDFSTLLPGPYGTMLLADMGADVLRVESPTRLDMVRVLPPMDGKQSAAHGYLNRGKKSLALDLKQDGAKEIIYDLVREYDIVVEQFRPGVMARLGLDFETLKAINPALIYCSITGYGQTGPYANRAGHDINYLSLAGVSSYSGRAGQCPPVLGIQVADVAGGSHHAVMGILAAVIHRQQTGKGQHIDISMTDAAFAMNAMSGAGFLAGGPMPECENQALNGGSFYQYYETADGRYFSVGSLEPQFLQPLCKELGEPGLASFGISQKPEDQQKLIGFLRDKFREHDFSYWQEFFARLDICVEPVLNLDESIRHPQLQSRQMVLDVERSDQPGEYQSQIGYPIKFSQTPCATEHNGVPLGQHSAEVLLDLGYDQEKIEKLRKSKVIR